MLRVTSSTIIKIIKKGLKIPKMLKCVKMITLSNKESEKTEENNKSSIA